MPDTVIIKESIDNARPHYLRGIRTEVSRPRSLNAIYIRVTLYCCQTDVIIYFVYILLHILLGFLLFSCGSSQHSFTGLSPAIIICLFVLATSFVAEFCLAFIVLTESCVCKKMI